MMLTFIIVFLFSSFLLVLAAKWLIDSLSGIAKALGWKEFVVAFFTVSFGAVAPEFFVGVSAAINGVPELAFGNILGQNILLFSFTIGVCAIVLRNGIEVESKTVRVGSTFAVVAAILPLILVLNGQLSRIDGAILLIFFLFFVFWLFSKKERFTKIYEGVEDKKDVRMTSSFIKNLSVLALGFLVIILGAQGIVESSRFFSEALGASLPMIGILILAAGVGLPETYFSLMLARKGQSWMILGGLMGAVAISSTLVLGTVSMISPITVEISVPTLFIARMFLIICALFYLFFVRTGRRISTKEGIILLVVYVSFFVLQILFK